LVGIGKCRAEQDRDNIRNFTFAVITRVFDRGDPEGYVQPGLPKSNRIAGCVLKAGLAEIEKRANVKFEYIPILLGGIFRPPTTSARRIARRHQEQARSSTRWRPTAS